MEVIYLLLGLIAFATSLRSARHADHPSRWRSCAFFGLLGLMLVAAPVLPAALTGALVLLLLVLGCSGLQRYSDESAPEQRVAAAKRFGNRLFWPAVLLPLLAVLGALWLKYHPLPGFPVERLPLVALTLAAFLSLLVALQLTRSSVRVVPGASARLFDALGWAGVLPLLLAILGSLLAQAGTAQALAEVVRSVLPTDSRLVCLLAYGLGMAGLTAILGNAFAAFPVMAGAIGVPMLVVEHGANPAPMAALGMLCGYCGTLLSPIAANFNLVPVALLELPDRYAVIKAQVGTALPLLAGNLVLLGLFLWWPG